MEKEKNDEVIVYSEQCLEIESPKVAYLLTNITIPTYSGGSNDVDTNNIFMILNAG